MTGCACGTSRLDKKITSRTLIDSNAVDWTEGTFAEGATLEIISASKPIALAGIMVPNLLLFPENPCIEANQSIIIDDLNEIKCLKGVVACLVATASATLVNGYWEVPTNGAWTSLSGTNSQKFDALNGSLLCGTSSANAPKAPEVMICGVAPNPADYDGYIFSRPLNSAPEMGTVYVTPNSNLLKVKGSYRPTPGDSIDLKQTALTGANAAVVTHVMTTSSGTVIEIDKPVIGITVSAAPNELPCSDAISRPKKIAELVFSFDCGCRIIAKLPKAISSSNNFPRGRLSNTSGCSEQSYCFQITRDTPGETSNVASGQIHLR